MVRLNGSVLRVTARGCTFIGRTFPPSARRGARRMRKFIFVRRDAKARLDFPRSEGSHSRRASGNGSPHISRTGGLHASATFSRGCQGASSACVGADGGDGGGGLCVRAAGISPVTLRCCVRAERHG